MKIRVNYRLGAFLNIGIKTALLLVLVAVAATGFLLAQGRAGSNQIIHSQFRSYDPGSSPPLSLPEAYGLALSYLGAASNTQYCVAASCLENTNNFRTGWNFVFATTNAECGLVFVYFDKSVEAWSPSKGSWGHIRQKNLRF